MKRSRLVVLAANLGLFAWLFAGVLFQSHNFVYRDVSHFYYPLFEQVQSEWRAGRVPLWNAQENSGMPLLASPTASVLYPGKLIFALPLSFDAAFKGYILGHVLLAAGAAYHLARRFGAGIEAAGLCGLSYAFSGNVLFQYCNVVFLCGAAWLPCAISAGERMLVGRSRAWAAALGAVLALMTLAGDPQMAYLAGALVALYALLLWRSPEAASPNDEVQDPSNDEAVHGAGRHRLVLLGFSASVAFLLSAVQTLPTAEFNHRSLRSLGEVPYSLYEIPGFLSRNPPMPRSDTGQPPGWYDGLIGNPPPPGGHHQHIYQFSVAPWRLAEYLWPNFSGREFPVNQRWLEVFPAESGVWAPSLYMGLLPFLLAIGSWRLRNTNLPARWLSATVLLAVLASFGSFGLAWLVREILSAVAPAAAGFKIGDEVGGLYWLLTLILPGFASFRFPGKLLVVAGLGLSLLAAQGAERLLQGSWPRMRRLIGLLGLLSLLGLIATLALGPWWNGWLAGIQADGYFGPFDPAGAFRDLAGSFMQTTILCGVLWFVLGGSFARHVGRIFNPAKSLSAPQSLGVAILALTACDLALANRWLIQSAPSALWHAPPKLAEVLKNAERQRLQGETPEPGPIRVFRLSSLAQEESRTQSSAARHEEGLVWDRDTLFPKHHLQAGISLVQTSGTMELYDYELFMSASVRENATGKPEYVQPRRGLDAWGARYFIVPRRSRSDDPFGSTIGLQTNWREPRWQPEHPQGAPEGPPLESCLPPPGQPGNVPDVEVYYNPSHFPRAWIVHQIQAIRPLDRGDRRSTQIVMQSILYPHRQWLDLRRTALVEDEALLQLARHGQLAFPPADPGTESCRMIHDDPQRVEIEAVLASPGLVVLADVHYPGWVLEVETAGTITPHTVLRTNRMMRGVLLPPGRHRLIYRFVPTSFHAGATLSGLSWLAFVCGALIVGWRARFRPTNRGLETKAFRNLNRR